MSLFSNCGPAAGVALLPDRSKQHERTAERSMGKKFLRILDQNDEEGMRVGSGGCSSNCAKSLTLYTWKPFIVDLLLLPARV